MFNEEHFFRDSKNRNKFSVNGNRVFSRRINKIIILEENVGYIFVHCTLHFYADDPEIRYRRGGRQCHTYALLKHQHKFNFSTIWCAISFFYVSVGKLDVAIHNSLLIGTVNT